MRTRMSPMVCVRHVAVPVSPGCWTTSTFVQSTTCIAEAGIIMSSSIVASTAEMVREDGVSMQNVRRGMMVCALLLASALAQQAPPPAAGEMVESGKWKLYKFEQAIGAES